MHVRHANSVILAMTLALGSVPAVMAEPQSAGSPASKREQFQGSDPGAELFRGYCAPCHGAKGVGDGPAAAALRTKPTDLTRLAAANQGQFPALRVNMAIEFGVAVPAHGTTDMPIWGSAFRAMGDEASVRERVSALTRYVGSLQAK